MRKTETAITRCKTMSTLQKMLGGKWKLEILYYIAFYDIHRFGALRRQLGEITESSLTKWKEFYGCAAIYETVGRGAFAQRRVLIA